jgi:hypothetical protein
MVAQMTVAANLDNEAGGLGRRLTATSVYHTPDRQSRAKQ